MPHLPPPEALPRVLVFSEGVISRTHGTGTIFERNFAAYPAEKIANWFIGLSENPLLPGALNLNAARWPRGNFSPPTTFLAKFWNRTLASLTGRKWCVPVNRTAIRDAVRAQAAQFDLVYAIVLTREGFDALAAVLDGLGRPVPVVLQIQDFFPHAHLGFWRAVRRLAPRISEVWVVAPSIAKAIALHLPGKPVQIDPLFNLDLPPQSKTEHHEFSLGFRTVVLGNFWNPELLTDLKRIWRLCQQRLPGLPPIRWHCHPAGIARLRAAGFAPETEVEAAPFLSGESLFAMLREADLAIIPFSQYAQPATDYERYSLPSRVTELAAAGLPIVGLTGEATPLYDYLTGKGIGTCVPAAATTEACLILLDLINRAIDRAKLGTNARRVAEAEFPIALQQARIYGAFARIAAGAGRSE